MSDQRLQGWNKQKTVFTYANDRKFDAGLRKGSLYADLGLSEATGGQFHGEIIKINPDNLGTDKEKQTTSMHRHHYDFQFNYVLAGEIDLVIEGEEKTTCRAGDTYFIPSRALHDETRVTEDFQVMQIYGPAKAQTDQLGQAVGGGQVSEDWAKKQSKMSEQRLTGWNKQKPAFTNTKDRKYGTGLRRSTFYADLGLAEATGENFHGELQKLNPDKHTAQGTTGMHRHDYDFQFNFVLAGEIDLVIDGIEEKKTVRAGDTFFLPHKILHNETRVSDDFQNLQVFGPANSKTVQLEPEID
jgi:quercetin dioxygenase-like cupin family protein